MQYKEEEVEIVETAIKDHLLLCMLTRENFDRSDLKELAKKIIMNLDEERGLGS